LNGMTCGGSDFGKWIQIAVTAWLVTAYIATGGQGERHGHGLAVTIAILLGFNFRFRGAWHLRQ